MAMRARRRLAGWGGLLLSVLLMGLIWVLVVWVSALPELKFLWDWTPQQSASVSETTKTLIKELRKQENLRFEIHTFFEPMAGGQTAEERAVVGIFKNLQRLTFNLLRQYEALGGDSIKVVHNDLRRSPDVAGQNRLKFRIKHRNSMAVTLFLKGEDGNEVIRTRELVIHEELAVIETGERIPTPGSQSQPPRLVDFVGEAAVSSAIKTLLAEGSPKILFVTGHQEAERRVGDSFAYTQLLAGLRTEGFGFGEINLATEEVPADAGILACLEPQVEFSDQESQKLLAYLRQGGRVFLNLGYVVRPWDKNVDLEQLLQPLGLRVGRDLVAQFYQGLSGSDASQLEIRNVSGHKITRLLRQQQRFPRLVLARELTRILPPPKGVSVDPSLLRTQPGTWIAQRHDGPDSDPNWAPPSKREAYGSRCVGAIVDVQPTEKAKEKGKRHGQMVVISGKAFHNDFFRKGSQTDLGLNIFNWLAERSSLVTGRQDPYRARALDLGTDLEARAARLRRTGWFLMFFVPALFFVLGVLVFWRRRRI